jgi:hypothetical protein
VLYFCPVHALLLEINEIRIRLLSLLRKVQVSWPKLGSGTANRRSTSRRRHSSSYPPTTLHSLSMGDVGSSSDSQQGPPKTGKRKKEDVLPLKRNSVSSLLSELKAPSSCSLYTRLACSDRTPPTGVSERTYL